MSKFVRIKDHEIHPERNAVFVAFYADPSHIYQSNPDCRAWGDHAWYAKVGLLGVLMRYDGALGFVGGLVDENETLIEAAIREVKEETDVDITPDQLTVVCSHLVSGSKNGEKHTHLLAAKLTPEKMYEMRDLHFKQAAHSKVECAGLNIVHLAPTAKKNLMNNEWAGSGSVELSALFDSGLLKEYEYEKNDQEEAK